MFHTEHHSSSTCFLYRTRGCEPTLKLERRVAWRCEADVKAAVTCTTVLRHKTRGFNCTSRVHATPLILEAQKLWSYNVDKIRLKAILNCLCLMHIAELEQIERLVLILRSLVLL